MIATPLGVLPRSYVTLCALIGEVEAIRLVQRFGGRRLAIPTEPSAQHWLCSHISFDALQRVASHWGGGQLSVPRCLVLRNEAIVTESQLGLSQSRLAGAHGRTERQIRRILAKARGRDKCPQ